MVTEAQVKKSDKIEICTDGSWLQKGAGNPQQAGGWGAVVLEYRGSVRTLRLLSGPTPERVDKSTQTEVCAVLSALQDICKNYDLKKSPNSLPPITLYVDDVSVVQGLRELGKNLNHKPEQYTKGFGENFQDLAALIRAMDVSVKHVRGSRKPVTAIPDTPEEWSAQAHALAQQAAWLSRLEKQGYITYAVDRRLTGKTAIEAIKGNNLASAQPQSRSMS